VRINTMIVQTDEQLISGGTAARILDVDPATIRRWKREGAPSYHKGHNLIRYKLSELEKWRSERPVKKITASPKEMASSEGMKLEAK
jgi:hypothetical protein